MNERKNHGPGGLAAIRIHVRDEVLADLRQRLRATRWPTDLDHDDTSYGVARTDLERLVHHWADEFDWHRAEDAINEYQHHQVTIDDVPVHFMFRGGARPDAIPLILTHGWPWTFWHWSRVVDALASPPTDVEPCFDVIVPSLPGFGFSTPLDRRGDLNFWRTADIWHSLMTEVLGYERYVAGGCDVGALVTAQLGHRHPDAVRAIHIGSALKLSLFNGDRAWDLSGGQAIPDDLPAAVRGRIVEFDRRFAVHLAVQVLTPSTLGFSLSDSPAGMLAWVLERWTNWSDHGGDVETVFSADDLCTQATIYWATNSIGTSMRMYANNQRYPWHPSHDQRPVVEVPTGITFMAYENPPGVDTANRVQHFLASDRASWYRTVNVTVHDHGGHFIPWENPTAWIDDLRRTVRIGWPENERL